MGYSDDSGCRPMFKQLVRPIYHTLYRSLVRVRCYWEDWRSGRKDLPPAMLRFRVSESTSEKLFVDIGQNCAHIIAGLLSERGQANEGSRVLDFGCGCGRTIKWLIADHPEAAFSGCDIDPEAIRWCHDHLRKVPFRLMPRCRRSHTSRRISMRFIASLFSLT